LKTKEWNETSDLVASNLAWLVSYEASMYCVCEVKNWCVTHVMDISFLLYLTPNFDWACLSSVRRSYKSNVPSFAICLPYTEGNTGRGWLYTKCLKVVKMRFKCHICFSTTLIWMHSTRRANFGFNEEWLVDQILQKKNWRFWRVLVPISVAHSMMENFHFSIKFQILFTKSFDLKSLPTTWSLSSKIATFYMIVTRSFITRL
jgi:hypothetical protein